MRLVGFTRERDFQVLPAWQNEEREINAVARLVSAFIASYENKTKMNSFLYLNLPRILCREVRKWLKLPIFCG